MNIRTEKVVALRNCRGDGRRIQGYVEHEGSTIAMYIVDDCDTERNLGFNLIVGEWGKNSEIREGKEAVFARLFLDPEPHFVFEDPSDEQARAFSKLSECVLDRSSVLVSSRLPLFKRILDVIYLQEKIRR